AKWHFAASATWPSGAGLPRKGDTANVRFRRSFEYASFAAARATPTTPQGRPEVLHEWFVKLHLMMQRDRGQTMAEDAVVLAVVASGIFVARGNVKGAVTGALNKVASDI